MDYASFLSQQASAIVAQFFADGNLAWIGVPDLGILMQRQTVDGGQVGPLPGVAGADAVIWRDGKGRAELWVRPEDRLIKSTNLHATCWAIFVQLVAGTAPQPVLAGRKLEVDHLYPGTAAARNEMSHVRVMAVDKRSNSTAGSTTENAAANDKPGAKGRHRSATYFTMAKVSGFRGSFAKSNDSLVVARALLDHLRGLGYPVPAGAYAPLELQLTARQLDWFRGEL
jgi:hypothetical protein